MTKIKTILRCYKFQDDRIEINVEDYESGEIFLTLHLNSVQMMNFLTSNFKGYVDGEIKNLHLVGKKLETDELEFELEAEPHSYKKRAEYSFKKALEVCPEGWIVDNKFNLQSSFFTKDGKSYARCTIRRWV